MTSGPFDGVAPFGEFFAVADLPDDSGWPTVAGLSRDETTLRERVGATRRSLAERAGVDPGEIEERAAASIWFLGFAARVVSPPFGAAVVNGTVPRLTAERTHVTPAGPIAVGSTDGSTTLGPVVTELLGPLIATVGRTFTVSDQILRGNTASSLAGAAIVVSAVRPALAGPAARLLTDTLADGLLAGTGEVRQGRFQRTSCCLYYRLPRGGLCGDCVLAAAPR